MGLVSLVCLLGAMAYSQPAPLRIATPTLFPVDYQPYSFTLAASGGTPPYTWAWQPSRSAGLTLDPSTGRISGAPFNADLLNEFVPVTVTDAAGQTAQTTLTLAISPRLVAGSPVSLSTIGFGSFLSEACAVVAGALPPGLTYAANPAATGCLLSGNPSRAGSYPVTFQGPLLDNRLSANLQYDLLVQTGATEVGNLPDAVAGTAYTHTLQGFGGAAPYQYELSSGSLPSGLNFAAGTVSGIPTKLEFSQFYVRITDSSGLTSVQPFGINVALPTLATTDVSLTTPVAVNQQSATGITLARPFPYDLRANISTQFFPDPTVNVDDPNIALGSAGRTTTLTIPANTTSANLPGAQSLATGTTAGDIVVTSTLFAGARDVTPSPAPVQVIHVGRSTPVLQSVSARAMGNSLSVSVSAYSTTHEVTQAVFAFTAVPDAKLTMNSETVDLSGASNAYFSSNTQYGGLFQVTVTFAIREAIRNVSSVSVTISNSVGPSSPTLGQVTQ